MTVTALIVAAGTGSRMGGIPKQFMSLAGRPMIAHSYEAFERHSAIDNVVVVIGEGQQEMLEAALGTVPFVIGGATRRTSARNGLEWLGSKRSPSRVLIHDAARPLVPSKVIDDLLDALDRASGAVPALLAADTLARGVVLKGSNGSPLLTIGEVVDRSEIVRVQTPQAFHFDAIVTAHRDWPEDKDASDDAQMLLRAGGTVAMTIGDPMLDKVTWPGDIPFAEAKLKSTMVSHTGMGFDVHAFAGEGPIMLGGIAVPHSRGLAGHSDADVVLHAITDALLGAGGLGDIGEHFPPSNPIWKGMSSDRFLGHAVDLLRSKGAIIDHVDCTIIAEEPKMGPHRSAMRARIAEIAGLNADQVSIKATTTEGLGFTGRREGIAAQAVASIRMGPIA